MRHEISISADLKVPLQLGAHAMQHILDQIAAEETPYEEPALSVALRGLHLPLTGRVCVPIAIAVTHSDARRESTIAIAATASAEAFPKFEGLIGITPLREYGSQLWLQGAYEIPLGWAGEAIDRTIMKRAAHESLQHFIDWLALEIAKRVEEEQRTAARHRILM